MIECIRTAICAQDVADSRQFAPKNTAGQAMFASAMLIANDIQAITENLVFLTMQIRRIRYEKVYMFINRVFAAVYVADCLRT